LLGSVAIGKHKTCKNPEYLLGNKLVFCKKLSKMIGNDVFNKEKLYFMI